MTIYVRIPCIPDGSAHFMQIKQHQHPDVWLERGPTNVWMGRGPTMRFMRAISQALAASISSANMPRLWSRLAKARLATYVTLPVASVLGLTPTDLDKQET